MFAKSIIASSLVALVMGKPVARRNFDISGQVINVAPTVSSVHPGSFDINSATVTGFNPQQFSFNDFGGLSSLNGFDSFYGQNINGQNVFHGGFNQHILVEQQVCQVTQVNVVQQHLAIIAEYAKQIILTQSCEVEAQTLLFTQWLSGLTSWGNDLRHLNGVVPTFDSQISSQIINLVNIDQVSHVQTINNHDFGFSGSSIGNHAVTVIGNNWVNEVSPSNVGFVWNSALSASGLSFPSISSSFPSSSNGVIVSQKKA
jgi:hypothetical protein